MATELDVSKSRHFDIAMSRRTRRSTSLVACFQDQFVPPLAQHLLQDAKLKKLLQCPDRELQELQRCDDVEQQTPCLDEAEELKTPQAPLQYEDGERKTPKQNQDEEQKEPQQYNERQKKPEQYQDEENKQEQDLDAEKTTDQYQDEDDKTSQYQDEEQATAKQNEEAPEQHEDEEQKAPQQLQEAEEQKSPGEQASEQYEEEEQEWCNTEEQTPGQCQGVKNPATPPYVVKNVPRFSLQELIQEKQLPIGEAKSTNKLGVHGTSVLADHKVSGSGGAATGGATLAMVIKRPEGGKKSMGMIRRCVKALNQMIKSKHGSKKNIHF